MKTNNSFMCVSSLSICEIKSVLDDLVQNGDIIFYAFVQRKDSVIVFIDPRRKVSAIGLVYLLNSPDFIECSFDEWCDKFNYYDVISVCITQRYIHTLEV